MICDVTDLDVYRRAMEALDLIYQLARQLPASQYKQRNQLTSAAEGVPANIAEGFAKRRSAKEFKRFLEIGLGSSDEVITHARSIKVYSNYARFIDIKLCDQVVSEYKIISKQLNKLRQNWIDYQK